jgi:hypothetical protein
MTALMPYYSGGQFRADIAMNAQHTRAGVDNPGLGEEQGGYR